MRNSGLELGFWQKFQSGIVASPIDGVVVMITSFVMGAWCFGAVHVMVESYDGGVMTIFDGVHASPVYVKKEGRMTHGLLLAIASTCKTATCLGQVENKFTKNMRLPRY